IIGQGTRGRQETIIGQGTGGRQESVIGQVTRDRQENRDGQRDGDRQGPHTDDTAGKYQVCLDFSNDTEHLAQTDIPFLFDRFYTADHARPGGSTGLGLTISKLLTEAMGGNVTAQLTEQGELHLMFEFLPA
ncbi:MAG: sensor histidine kinase, partial [Acetatifactor sp.]|nr:sensor histidine kinase [Acetatifactor sp.]